MNIGNKITSLRKNMKLSQEELAEKIGVTRQTISKWELEETSPDIKQAKELSKIFNVSLDEFTNNDINNIIIQKVNNTERLATITINILKIFGIVFILLIIGTISFIVFGIYPSKSKSKEVFGKYNFSCNIDDGHYTYGLEYNKDFQILTGGGDAYISNHTNVESYDDANTAKAHIEDWFKDHNGSCTVEEN